MDMLKSYGSSATSRSFKRVTNVDGRPRQGRSFQDDEVIGSWDGPGTHATDAWDQAMEALTRCRALICGGYS